MPSPSGGLCRACVEPVVPVSSLSQLWDCRAPWVHHLESVSFCGLPVRSTGRTVSRMPRRFRVPGSFRALACGFLLDSELGSLLIPTAVSQIWDSESQRWDDLEPGASPGCKVARTLAVPEVGRVRPLASRDFLCIDLLQSDFGWCMIASSRQSKTTRALPTGAKGVKPAMHPEVFWKLARWIVCGIAVVAIPLALIAWLGGALAFGGACVVAIVALAVWLRL